MPAQQAIYFACVNFLFLFSFLMITQRTIISSGSTGTIFTIFSPNESILGADDRSGPLFSDISRDVANLPWQPIL